MGGRAGGRCLGSFGTRMGMRVLGLDQGTLGRRAGWRVRRELDHNVIVKDNK